MVQIDNPFKPFFLYLCVILISDAVIELCGYYSGFRSLLVRLKYKISLINGFCLYFFENLNGYFCNHGAY